jgi:hypothetical protein
MRERTFWVVELERVRFGVLGTSAMHVNCLASYGLLNSVSKNSRISGVWFISAYIGDVRGP